MKSADARLVHGGVLRTIRERGLPLRNTSAVVAISGGPDSLALLASLARLREKLGLELTAASIDHGLRSTARDDVEIAREQAAHFDVPFVSSRVRVVRGSVDSLQSAARRARYTALHAIAKKSNATAIAVGHTLDDQAESVLIHLLRGASLRGLRGTHSVRSDGVVRPLIDLERRHVHAFAEACGVPVARDPSNVDSKYLRVRVRLEVLPLLQELAPRIVRDLALLADDVTELLHETSPMTPVRGVAARLAGAITAGRGEVLAKGGYRVRIAGASVLVEPLAAGSIRRARGAKTE